MDINKLFKVGILVMGIVFLLLFYQYSNNNRYQYIPQGKNIVVFDTQKGTFHSWLSENGGWVFLDPVNRVQKFEAEK